MSAITGLSERVELFSEEDFPKARSKHKNSSNGVISKIYKILSSGNHHLSPEQVQKIEQFSKCLIQFGKSAKEIERNLREKSNPSVWNTEPSRIQAIEDALRKSAGTARETFPIRHEQTQSQMILQDVTVTPNFLPSIEELSTQLSEISTALQVAMSKALNPNKPTGPLDLRRDLKNFRSQFTKLREKAGDLKQPVSERAKHLDQFIESTRKNMAIIWISKTVCDWQIIRIDIFANIFSNLESLQQTMAGLAKENENLKEFLRKNPFSAIDSIKLQFDTILSDSGEKSLKEIIVPIRELLAQYPETASSKIKDALLKRVNKQGETTINAAKPEMQACIEQLPKSSVDEAKRQFTSIQRKYGEYKEQAVHYRKDAEKAIKALTQLITDAEMKLVTSIKEISFHDPSVKAEVMKKMESSISSIQEERNTLLYQLNERWKAITDQFSADSNGHLFYDINRNGYAIFENLGGVPYDSMYGVWGAGWSITKPYVTAFESTEDS